VRASAAILALAGLLTPLAAAGVGLGEIELDSYIDEPFEGRIELIDVERDEIDRIRARLGSEADFRAAGIERTPSVQALDFEPVWEEGGAYLRVTTSRPVTRTFLDFLVELEWPAGRQLRGYTVLLDPPDTTDEEPAAVDAPAAASEPVAGSQGATTLEYGRVQEGERLWTIAQELRQRIDEEVTTEQVAMALLRDNPEAFQGGNVNRLMAGYVLRIDETDSIRQVGAEEARTEFWRQYRAWQDFRQERAEQATQRPSREAGAADGESAESGEGSTAEAGAAAGQGAASGLTLEGPEAMATGEAEAPGGGEEGAADGSRIQELQNELDAALAEAESRREGNEALRERLAAMEEQLQSMERLLEFDSSELAALQEGRDEETATDELALFLELLNRHPQWVGVAGGLFILLLALVWVAARRHSGGSGKAEQEPRPRRVRSEEEHAEAEAHAPRSEDPVTEADIYFSMGRYAEAVEVLEKAVAHHPRHAEYRRRLAELHHAHGNREAFLREARSMRQDLGESAPMEWARVAALGATMAPDDPLFAQPDSEPEPAPAAEADSGTGPVSEGRPADAGDEPGRESEGDEDEERIDASLEDEFAELMGEGDHRAEWDEALAGEEAAGVAPAGPAGESPEPVPEPASPIEEEPPAPIELETGAPEEGPGTVGEMEPESEPEPEPEEVPVVDLDLAEDWVEDSPESAFAHAAEEVAEGRDSTPESGPDERAAEPENPEPEDLEEAVIDLETPEEGSTTTPAREAATPMDAAELEEAYNDLLAGEAAETVETAEEPATRPGPDTGPAPEQEVRPESADSRPEPGPAADTEEEVPEGLHPLEADESAAWDEFEDDVADLLNDVDEVGTKLDLARAYIDMGDAEGARGILEEVMEEGSEEQQQEARSLLDQSQG
jgi:pilus assembly protein FimV